MYAGRDYFLNTTNFKNIGPGPTVSITQNMSRGPQGRNIRNGKIETRITTVEFHVIRRNPNAPLFAQRKRKEREREMGKRKGREQKKVGRCEGKEVNLSEQVEAGAGAESRFFACYLLTSMCPRFKGHTYIGFVSFFFLVN